MKHTADHFLHRVAAFTLAAILALPTVYADAGEKKLQTSAELTEGLTYRNTVTVNQSSRVESFAMELAPDSETYPILLQASGTIYGAASINKAVSHAESLGYHVMGAVNTDFFSLTSGVPIGIVIENGVYKSSAEQEDAILITDGEVMLCQEPAVSLSLYNQRTGEDIVPHHLNKWRNKSGGLYLLNQDFSTVSTRTTGDGWYVRMKVTGGDKNELSVNSSLTLQVTELLQSDQAIAIGEGEYILTADSLGGYLSTYQSFQVGDMVTLTTVCRDEALSRAQWACGVGDVMVLDGAVTDSSSWNYTGDGRQPRTALGVKKDGTLLVYAVDGRRSGYSSGLSQKDLADEMLKQGCDWAVNLDGGGSTAVSLRVPGQDGPAVHNLPSDGRPRSCATYLLLVRDQAGNGQASRLAFAEDGLTVLSGTSISLPETVVLDDGLEILTQAAEDVTVTSQGLGTVEDGIYFAGNRAGTDELSLRSKRLGVRGSAQIHVVDELTEITVSRQGSTSALTALKLRPGESVQLSVSGSYWGRKALWDESAVTWTVTGDVGTVDKNGLFTSSAKGGSGTITAQAGGISQSIQVTFSNVHNDVPEGHWAYDAVEYCYTHGISSGISVTEFGADHQIQRADFMLMLYNAVGRPEVTAGCTFTDVKPADYYYQAISWGQSVGLAAGTGNGLYSPHEPVNREQAFTILRQLMPLVGKQCPNASLSVLDVFPDRDQIADYAVGHAATLVSQGIVAGGDSGIAPKGLLTRAQMAVMLTKILTFTPKTDVPTDPVVPPSGSLTLDRNELSLNSGESAVLKAVLEANTEGAAVVWSSSAPSVAAVNGKGGVTNLYAGEGTATAVITASWNGMSASCTVSCAPAGQVGKVVRAELGLKVRSGPGTSYDAIGGLANGTQVVVLEVKDGWCHVLYANKSGQAAIGYVSGDYMEVTRRDQ